MRAGKAMKPGKPGEALQTAMAYIGEGMRTTLQVREYLFKKGYSGHEISEAVDRLYEYRLLNDEEYARRFIECHPSSGRMLLRQKLAQKGIDRDTAAQAAQEIDPEQEVERALILLKQKLRGDPPYEREVLYKAMQAVQRRGFPYQAVRAAAQQLKAELDELPPED